jgi:hypothetical protein
MSHRRGQLSFSLLSKIRGPKEELERIESTGGRPELPQCRAGRVSDADKLAYGRYYEHSGLVNAKISDLFSGNLCKTQSANPEILNRTKKLFPRRTEAFLSAWISLVGFVVFLMNVLVVIKVSQRSRNEMWMSHNAFSVPG